MKKVMKLKYLLTGRKTCLVLSAHNMNFFKDSEYRDIIFLPYYTQDSWYSIPLCPWNGSMCMYLREYENRQLLWRNLVSFLICIFGPCISYTPENFPLFILSFFLSLAWSSYSNQTVSFLFHISQMSPLNWINLNLLYI